jgi:hypothetical protein
MYIYITYEHYKIIMYFLLLFQFKNFTHMSN